VSLRALELFSGAGGMTVGLTAAGFDVVGAIDNSPLAVTTYIANHPGVRVWEADVAQLDPLDVASTLGVKPGELDLLAGCPPCQGFSTIRTRRRGTSVPDPRNRLVAHFGNWIETLAPRAVMMENVPGLADDIRLRRLVRRLERAGYGLSCDILNAADYGVPQRRRRFVLLAVLGGVVTFGPRASRRATVREAIGGLPEPALSDDPLHNHGETRSRAVLERIAAIPPGGGLRLMDEELQLECHRRTKGFYDVYGRMSWDAPAPTITGGCINPSKGRFLHPDQNRAITLREALLLQSFPPDYRLSLERGKYRAAELIGNALPPVFVHGHAEQLSRALRRSTGLPNTAAA
jgi:DNA (cytosine-5)-methyltransferase 1